MHKKVTLYIASHSGSRVRQLTFSRRAIAGVGVVLVSLSTGLGWMALDYADQRKGRMASVRLASELAKQSEIVGLQNRKLQLFAQRVNGLESELASLHDFEQRVRILANLDSKGTAVFGVGGVSVEIDDRLAEVETQTGLMQDIQGRIDLLDKGAEEKIESFEGLVTALEAKRNLLAATPSIRPAKGWISSDFGYRKSPFTERREFHRGIDIANRKGTLISATADGVVSYVGNKRLIGNMVVIDHGHGMITKYGHLMEALVKRGQKVKRGEAIAKMGSTGRSTGPHVHYEVRVNGMPEDPKKYILN